MGSFSLAREPLYSHVRIESPYIIKCTRALRESSSPREMPQVAREREIEGEEEVRGGARARGLCSSIRVDISYRARSSGGLMKIDREQRLLRENSRARLDSKDGYSSLVR